MPQWYNQGMRRQLRASWHLVLKALPWFALMAQIALGASVPADSYARNLAQSVIDCEAPSEHTPARDHRPAHAPDGWVLCTLSMATALPALTPVDGPVLPPPAEQRIGRLAMHPPARAPPMAGRFHPPTRAPPALV
jgi:hypothetical protein